MDIKALENKLKMLNYDSVVNFKNLAVIGVNKRSLIVHSEKNTLKDTDLLASEEVNDRRVYVDILKYKYFITALVHVMKSSYGEVDTIYQVIVDSSGNMLTSKSHNYLSDKCSLFYEDAENWILLGETHALYWDKKTNRKYKMPYKHPSPSRGTALRKKANEFIRLADGIVIMNSEYINFNMQKQVYLPYYVQIDNAILVNPADKDFTFSNNLEIMYVISKASGDIGGVNQYSISYNSKSIAIKAVSLLDTAHFKVEANYSKKFVKKNIIDTNKKDGHLYGGYIRGEIDL